MMEETPVNAVLPTAIAPTINSTEVQQQVWCLPSRPLGPVIITVCVLSFPATHLHSRGDYSTNARRASRSQKDEALTHSPDAAAAGALRLTGPQHIRGDSSEAAYHR